MRNKISELNPKELWKNFYSLTQIPRPSGNLDKIIDFMIDFGKNLGLETFTDKAKNVIIRKPATPGKENVKGVILQAHLDMVPQKNNDKEHNFDIDPIEAYIDGNWVTANGTTLGADNGIGVAAAMAILESKDIEHGPIEALFTIDEETGMYGAFGLEPNILKGDILLNLDSEDEGELYVGCAGGTNANVSFNYKKVETEKNTVAFKISLTGLKGGHSGIDIILGRGNANKLMFRVLKEVVIGCGARLAEIKGGSLRNAIPREAVAVVTVPENETVSFIETIEEYEKIFKNEISEVEPNLKIEAVKCDTPSFVFDELSQDDLINAIQACPNGVIRMSDTMKGVVETSLNLATVISTEDKIDVLLLIRSSVDSAKADVESTLESLFNLAGAKIFFDGQYPGWKPNSKSQILGSMSNIYKKLYNKTPDVKAIHAGLECGILGSAYPNWDMISFGPTIRFPHSPDEKVNIKTVELFWEFLVETLVSL